MEHIRDHFAQGVDFDTRKPDDDDLRYLRKQHLISKETYEHAVRGLGMGSRREETDDDKELDNRQHTTAKKILKSSQNSRKHDHSGSSHSHSGSKTEKNTHSSSQSSSEHKRKSKKHSSH